jgi:cytochrome P450
MIVTIPFFPMNRAEGCPLDPPPEMRRLCEQSPLSRVQLWDGSTPWLVTSYAAQRALLADPRVSADPRNSGYPHINAAIQARHEDARSFVTMDDPEHARQRRMVSGAFAVKRVEAMRPAIQRIVDSQIDEMLQGPKPADLVQAFALPVPSMVICELLGVPYADHSLFQKYSHQMIRRSSGIEDVLDAQHRLVDYLEDLIGARLAEPADDLLTQLAADHADELTPRELASTSLLLLVAGHETTANMIALGTVALLQNPSQLEVLRHADDPVLVAGAAEELLRYLPIVHSARRRVALEDIEIAAVTIRAGEGLVMPNEIGNRDAAVFSAADQLDIRRENARHHVGFGFGPHQCLGQPLVRVELQVVYGTLYRRIPTLALAIDEAQVPFKHDALIYGVHKLPVIW